MGTSSAPVYPYPGGTAGQEPPDPQAGVGGHFAWSNWIKQFVKQLDTQSAKRSGDTFSGTIESAVNAGLANLKLIYDGSPGVNLRGTSGGLEVRNSTMSTLTNVSAASPSQPDHLVTKAYADALAASALTSALPTGSVVMYAGSIAPTGWLLCNGQSTTGYPALAALVGATVPDLRDRFVVGAGPSYALKATGGAASVTLTAAQSGVPTHSHPATVDYGDASHGHVVDPPSTESSWVGNHSHGGHYTSHFLRYTNLSDTEGPDYVLTQQDRPGQFYTITPEGTHSHWTDIGAFWSANASINHNHSASVSNNTAANAAASHENRPPYYALTFIIKAV